MSKPTAYDRQTSFALYSAENPTSQQSGTSLDAEFNAVKISIDETQQNLALIQDDDGALKRGSVGQAQFDSSVSLGFGAPAQWVSGKLYTADVDTVFSGNKFYIATVTHTSDVSFDATKFALLADFTASAVIPDGSITSAKLASGAVAADKIASGSVSTDKIAAGAVTTSKIADASVTMAKIADVTAIINAVLPAGLGPLPWSGFAPPTGWLLCAGQAISRTSYPALWALAQAEITRGSIMFGAGDGFTTFTMPDLRGRVIAGKDNMLGTAANRITIPLSGIAAVVEGAAGGTESRTITQAQLPNATLTVSASGSASVTSTPANILLGLGSYNAQGGGATIPVPSGSSGSVASTGTASVSGSTTSINGGVTQSAIGVTQPTLIANMIIKAH